MDNNNSSKTRLPVVATLLVALFFTGIIILLALDKQVPDYLSIALTGLITYLLGVFTTHPNDKEN